MFVKRLSLALLLALLALGLGAQDSDRYLKKMIQEGAVLYFITPTSFKAKPGKVKLEGDFTFQYSGGMPEAVYLRFSIFSKSAIRRLENLAFFSGENQIGGTGAPELIFLQKEKRKWHSRFSATLPYPTLLKLLQAGPEASIHAATPEKKYAFAPGKDWLKAAEILKEILAVEVDVMVK
jgi:hypothetical protein